MHARPVFGSAEFTLRAFILDKNIPLQDAADNAINNNIRMSHSAADPTQNMNTNGFVHLGCRLFRARFSGAAYARLRILFWSALVSVHDTVLTALLWK